MKKYLLLFISLTILSNSFSYSINKTPVKLASEIYINVGKNGAKISLLDISKISVKEYQILTGKQLNFFERISFKTNQKKVRKNITEYGTMSPKFTQNYANGEGMFSEFNIGGFALGLFLFLPGVLIAYLIGGDEDARSNRVRWAWKGTGVFVIIALAFFRSRI